MAPIWHIYIYCGPCSTARFSGALGLSFLRSKWLALGRPRFGAVGRRYVEVHGTLANWSIQDVVRSDQKVAADNEIFSIWVFFDPLYRHPLVLETNVVAQPETIFWLYLDRWPVEQVPLVTKQLLGLQ